MLLIARRA
jgi:hypothetical protein